MRPPQTRTERQRSKMGIMPLITKRWQNGTRNGLISSLSSVNPFCVEVLLRIHPQYAISKTVQLLKANSSKWINERRKHRLLLMNAMLQGIESDLLLGDTLSPSGQSLPKADVILTNPPFGTKKGGGLPTRDDFTFPTSNKQLAFLQHIYRALKPGGRAAVVLPDNVLFEDGVGAVIRRDMMDKCNLHTILRLPTGIFYAQDVKTNVLFFTRGEGNKDKCNTRKVWFYDMRANMPAFGKRTPLTHEHFKDFEKAYGTDPLGKSKRKDQGEEGRFRCYTREQIAALYRRVGARLLGRLYLRHQQSVGATIS